MRSVTQITVPIILQLVLLFQLEITSAKPKPQHDGMLDDMDFLSEWSSWSQCTRTCGTGIQFRGRRCYRDRRPCSHVPRQHRTCNNQLCSVDARDFRELQCSDEDSREMVFGGKKVKFKSIFRAMHPCAKFCHPIGRRTTLFFGRVIDGTKCADKPYSVCVRGDCTPIGCDRIVKSNKTFDKCQVCGGNGSSCKPFSGMVDKQPYPEDKKNGYTELFVIPVHATTILISEASTNYIAIKRRSGEYVFNGGEKVDSPGKYRVGLTDFKYSRLPDDFYEAVMIMGPTTEEFHVMGRLMDGDNVKLDYEYWLPKIIPTTTPTPIDQPIMTTPPTTTTPQQPPTTQTTTTTHPSTITPPTTTKHPVTTITTKHPITTTQPITTKHPVTTTQPTTTKHPVTTTQPITTKHPITTTQHITTKHPVTTTQPTSTKHPITTTQPITTKHPVTTTQPITTKHPITTTQPITTKHPITTTQPITTKHPITTTQHITTKHPITTTQPITTQHPVTTTQPITTKHPVTTTQPTTTKQPVTTGKPSKEGANVHNSVLDTHLVATPISTSSQPTTAKHPVTTEVNDVFFGEHFTKSSPLMTHEATHQGQVTTVANIETSTVISATRHPVTTPVSQNPKTPTEHPMTTKSDKDATVNGHDGTVATGHPVTTQATLQRTGASLPPHPSTSKGSIFNGDDPGDNRNVTNKHTTPVSPSKQTASTQRPTSSSDVTPHGITVNSTATSDYMSQKYTPTEQTVTTPASVSFKDRSSPTTSSDILNGTRSHKSDASKNNGTTEQSMPTTVSAGYKDLSSSANSSGNITVTDDNLNRYQKRNATKSVLRSSVHGGDPTATSQVSSNENSLLNGTSEPSIQLVKTEILTVNPELNVTKDATAKPNVTENVTVQGNWNITEVLATEVPETTAKTTTTDASKTEAQKSTTDQNSDISNTTENWNRTMEPTTATISVTTESRHVTVQPAIRETMDATTRPTTADHSETVQNTAANWNRTLQVTTTMESMTRTNSNMSTTRTDGWSATIKSTTEEIQNTTLPPVTTKDRDSTDTTTTEKLNVTMQFTTSRPRSTTARSTATERRNTSAQPTTMESRNATAQAMTVEMQTINTTATEEWSPATTQPSTQQNHNEMVKTMPTVTLNSTSTTTENRTLQHTTEETLNTTVKSVSEDRNETAQVDTRETLNTTVNPTIMLQNSKTQSTTENWNRTLKHTAKETLNTTVKSFTEANHNDTIPSEFLKTTVEPTSRAADVRNTNDNWNRTLQGNATETLHTTLKPLVADNENETRVQLATTKATNSTEQPTTAGTSNSTMEAMGVDSVNGTVQPNRMKKPNTTLQPVTKGNPSVITTPTIEQHKTLNATAKPIVEETENVTVTAQPTVTKRFNYTAQPTTLETLNATLEQPFTAKVENESMLSSTEQLVNTTVHPSITEPIINMTEKKIAIPWGPWTPCSRTCGMGFKVRARPCKKDTNEKDCLDNATQISLCIIEPCKRMPPTWSPWGAWTQCSSSCGIGVRVRIRSCRNSAVVSVTTSECVGRRVQVGFCRNTNCGRQGSTTISSSVSSFTAQVSVSVRKEVIKSPAAHSQSLTSKVLSSPTGSMLSSLTDLVQPTKTINVPLMSTVSKALPCQGQECLSTNIAEYAIPTTLVTTPSSTVSEIIRKVSSTYDVTMSPAPSKSTILELPPTSSSSSPSLSWKSSPSTSSSSVEASSRVAPTESIVSQEAATELSSVVSSSPSSSLTLPSQSLLLPSSSLPEPTSSTSSSLSGPTSSKMPSLSESTRSTASSSPVSPTSSTPSPSVTLEDKSVLLSSIPLQFSTAFSSVPPTPSSTLVPKGLYIQETKSRSSMISASSSISPVISSPSVASSAATSTPSMPSESLTAVSALHPLPSPSISPLASLPPSISTVRGSSTISPSLSETTKVVSTIQIATSSIAGSLQSMVSSSHPYGEIPIIPSQTIGLLQQSSSITLSGQTGSSGPEKCSPCRTSRKKNKHFCTSDYAIHVNVTKTYVNFNNKPMYNMYIVKTYKSTQPMPKSLSLRVPGQQCPCPYLEAGKEYVIFGKLRTKKKGQLRVMFNRRNFVQKWNASFDEEVVLLKKRCASTVQPTTMKTTTQPPPTTVATTTATPTVSCPSCRLSDNLDDIYCSDDFAIRAKVTKYRLATNRTMYYAHLITTYKTMQQLPQEVMIRVSGERCPCPPLVVGAEYLMVGTMKVTFTGKMRLALTLKSFVKKWDDELEAMIKIAKQNCGFSLVLGPPVTIIPTTKGTTLTTRQSESTQTTTAVPTTMTTGTMTTTIEPATEKEDVLCPSCRISKVSETQQKRYCKNDQVIRGRVISSYETSANRTFYLVAMVTTFKSTGEIPDRVSTRVADNACLCGMLSVGQEYLIMGRIKITRKGKSKMTLTRKSFLQVWEDSLYEKMDQMRTLCGNPVLEVTSKKLTVASVVPEVATPVTEKGPITESSGTPLGSMVSTEGDIVTPTKKSDICPLCRASANIQDFCSNDYVFRAQVFKKYSTSSNRTVYHANIITMYRSPLGQTDPVVLLRVPGIKCQCPQLSIGSEYVVMGYLRRKRKGPSFMALSRGSFVQPWNEGFVEELQSLQSSCKSDSDDVGSLVQLIADSELTPTKTMVSTETDSVTMPTNAPTLSSTTRDVTSAPLTTLISTENDVVMTTLSTPGRTCAPCQTSKRRNRLYCISDYVLAVQIQERVHNSTTKTTRYYATIQYTYKQQTPLDLLVVIVVHNDQCNCPNLTINQSYVVMANIEYSEKEKPRLVLPERPFVKQWSKGFHKKILRLGNYCSTGHRKL